MDTGRRQIQCQRGVRHTLSFLTAMCTNDQLNLLYVTITRATHYVSLMSASVDV